MKITQIKVGKWYETKQGTGVVLAVGGTYPPSVQFSIVRPFPRGKVFLSPRDVIRELDPPAEQEGEPE